MNGTHFINRNIITILSALFMLHSALGQGTLTPPGAPAPTMKTLTQIEPRTPISSLPYTISNSGSYYLTGNVLGVAATNGITIAADGVALDLNGFAVVGVAGSVYGIYVSGSHTNLAVRNGSVSGWGNTAIEATFPLRSVRLEHLNVSGNTTFDAVSINNALISDCTVEGGFNGLDVTTSDIHHCLVSDSLDAGIFADNSSVSDCQIQNCLQYGIYINLPGCKIVGNMLRGNNSSNSPGGAAIYVNDSDNRIENNQISGSGVAGIVVNNAVYVDNVVIRNTVSGNGANNYEGMTGNDFGPIGSASTATSPWANISH